MDVYRQYGDPGAPRCGRKKRGQHTEALGRSRGGFGTKIHVAVDGLGNPVEFRLSGGQEADVTHAADLIEGHEPEAVVADKAYDSDAFVGEIESRGAKAVIPPKKNRIESREVDWHVYKQRNLVERFINRIKRYRRVATRYDKTARNFLAFVRLAAIMVLLR